jgi:hypothetical protein
VLQPVPDAYTPPARYPLRKSFMTMAPVLLKNGIFVWAKRAAGRIGIG